jgi:hypothetical protein
MDIIIAQPFSFGHVIERVDLYCCYCCPPKAAVAAAADSRSYAALSLSSSSLPTAIQSHPPLLNNSGQVISRGSYSRQRATSGCKMMGTVATDNNQPAAAGKVGIGQCGLIGPPNSAAS